MIWGILTAIVAFITAIVVSLGKVSRIGETIANSHRDELLSRKNVSEKVVKEEDPEI